MSEITIPLNKMTPWSGNVRKTGAADGIAELAASIAAHGLLQSLVVRKAPRGKSAVVASRRRYTALKQLAGSGAIEADFPVPCRLLEGDTFVAPSLPSIHRATGNVTSPPTAAI
jgi:ParB family chromosome partitioning protein